MARASSAHVSQTLTSMISVQTRYSATSPLHDKHLSHFITSLQSFFSLDAIPRTMKRTAYEFLPGERAIRFSFRSRILT
jgi:hypothetical protein